MSIQDQALTRVCLGKIVAAHGVKGLVKILPFGEDPLLIESLSPVYTTEKNSETLSITLKNPIGRYWLAEVKGVSERNGAEALRGTDLYVAQDRLPKIKKKNTYYHVDLIGLKALDENGTEIGEVIAVENYGAGDLLEIKPKDRGSFLLPFIKEHVSEVNMEQRTAIIRKFQQFQELA